MILYKQRGERTDETKAYFAGSLRDVARRDY